MLQSNFNFQLLFSILQWTFSIISSCQITHFLWNVYDFVRLFSFCAPLHLSIGYNAENIFECGILFTSPFSSLLALKVHLISRIIPSSFISHISSFLSYPLTSFWIQFIQPIVLFRLVRTFISKHFVVILEYNGEPRRIS